MQTVFIFDDEYAFIEEITNILHQNAYNVVFAGTYGDAMQLLDKWVKAHRFPDLYIFDYYVNQKNRQDSYTGLDVAEKMLAQREVPSILITGERYNDEMRKRAKELDIDAKYKLSKEILTTAEGRNDFLDIVFEALCDGELLSDTETSNLKQQLSTIGIKKGLEDHYFFVEYSSVLYLEAKGNACSIVFNDRDSYTFGTTMNEIGKRIRLIHPTFVPAGRKHFVNLNNITELRGGTVSFKKGEGTAEISLPLPAYKRLRDKLLILKTR